MLRQPRPSVFNEVPFTFPFAGQSYARRILNTQPANLIADWQLGETSGSTAVNAEGTAARDGAYANGTTPNATTFTDGTPAPSFDGTNDIVNVYSSSLNSAFNGAEGSLLVWAKVSGAGVWTDASIRYIALIQVDASNRLYIRRNSTNNQLGLVYQAGGTAKTISDSSLAATTNWFCVALTWSKSADQVKAYLNGAQIGTTLTGLGTWVGSLSSTNVNVGAGNTSGGNGWSGYLKYAVLWTKALSASEIAALATV